MLQRVADTCASGDVQVSSKDTKTPAWLKGAWDRPQGARPSEGTCPHPHESHMPTPARVTSDGDSETSAWVWGDKYTAGGQQQDGALHPSSTSPAFITLRTVLALPNPSHFTMGLGIFPFPGGSNPSCSPPGKSHPQELRRGVVLLLSSSHRMLQI